MTAVDGVPGGDVAIEVRGLRKSYGSLEAVRGIDLRVERGEIFAMLGPNGAGKTTTVEILEGYRSRTGGEVQVLGHDPARRERDLMSRIGIVLQQSGVQQYLTVREVVAMYAGYYPHPRDVDEVIELVGLSEARRPADPAALGRAASPRGRGTRPGRRPGAPLPRRADDRLRPVRATSGVGDGRGRWPAWARPCS